MQPPLSIERAVQRAYHLALGALIPLAPVWMPWIGVLIGLEGIMLLLHNPDGAEGALSPGRDALRAVTVMLGLLFSLGLAVAWYRALLQERWPSGPLSIVVDPALPTYALRSLAVVVAALLGLAAMAMFALLIAGTLGTLLSNILNAMGAAALAGYPSRAMIVIGMVIGGLGGLYVFMRCALWLAAAAIDRREISLGLVWQQTLHHARPLTWGLLLIYVPLLVFEFGFQSLAMILSGGAPVALIETGWAPLGFILTAIGLLIGLFTTLASVSYVALIYQSLMKRS